MKKILIVLLASVMCLSLFACGNEIAPEIKDDGTTQQEEQIGSNNSDKITNDNDDKSETNLKSVLMNMGAYWSYVNCPTMGHGFSENGTVSGPDGNGTWELVDNIVTVTLEGKAPEAYEIKNINGAYYLAGEHDMLYGVNTMPDDIPFKEVEITLENWQEYFEFASATKEITDVFGQPTGELEKVNCLKLKDEYFKEFVRHNSDVRMKFVYAGSERESIMSDYWYEAMGCYFGESGLDSESGFEMVKVQGTLRFVDDGE